MVGELFFGILIHYILILTEKKDILKKWWVYLIIYIPVAIIVYVFSISNHMSMAQYNFVNTPLGWRNISSNNVWDWFFNIYYIGVTIIGVVLLYNWGRNSSDGQVKKEAKLILFSVIFTFVAGSFTDIFCSTYLSINMPQMAPIIMIVPIIVMCYLIMRYSLMKKEEVNEAEIILNLANRTKIYYYLAISYIAGGILNFVSQYLLYDNKLTSVMLPSLLLILIGCVILEIQTLKVGENFKEFINILANVIVIPIITLKFIKFASITIWAFPFILIIISIAYNKRIVLILTSLSIMVTQLIVWVIVPKTMVQVDGSDYSGRIGLFIIAILIASYINKIYIYKLKENAEQLELQKLISEISTDFISVNQLNLDEKINGMLDRCGKFLKSGRIYVVLFGLEDNAINYVYQLNNGEIGPKVEIIQNQFINEYPWLMNQIMCNEKVCIDNLEMLPKEALKEKQKFETEDIKSFVAIPFSCDKKVLGFLGFRSESFINEWYDSRISFLKILANVLTDALAKVNAEKEINCMAYYDYLTKLPNRVLFKDRVDQAIYLANRNEKIIALVFLDLDSFKNINDTLGHELGDELLKEVAEKLLKYVRKSDTVSRFGGDEFLIMINNNKKLEDIIKIVDNIMDMFNSPFILKEQEFFVTASAGIAIYPTDGNNTETLIKNADIAMYSAKDKGKNQYVVCSSDMKDSVHMKMKLTNNLYRAQERNELVLYYQPQVDLLSKQIIGLEALIRWNHPELGMIPPTVFIPLAEQTGLINSIGEWVLNNACRQNKIWQDMKLPHVRMAVNLSVNQFRNPDIVNQVHKVLQETCLDSKYLELEITESIAIKESAYIIKVLNRMKELGVSISIDDFGTEYSSLSRLKLLPIDRIKVDIQFVRGIEGSNKDKAITKAIINLAKNLELKVIAEGVETEKQLDFLTQGMCDEVQGYYYYKPMIAEDVELLLQKGLDAI